MKDNDMKNETNNLEQLQEIVKEAYELLQKKREGTILNNMGDILTLAGKIVKFVEVEASKKKTVKTT